MNDTTDLRALLLDFGGVLILPLNSPQRQCWLDRLGRRHPEFDSWMWHTEEAAAALRGEIQPDEFWIRIGQQVGLEEQEALAMAGDYWAGDRLNQAVVRLAQRARGRGLRVGLLSNAYCDLRPIIAPYGVLELFDEIVVSALVGIVKPDHDIYCLACSRLDVLPEETLFIDDNRGNVESAQQVGLRALRYGGEQTLEEAAQLLGLCACEGAEGVVSRHDRTVI